MTSGRLKKEKRQSQGSADQFLSCLEFLFIQSSNYVCTVVTAL